MNIENNGEIGRLLILRARDNVSSKEYKILNQDFEFAFKVRRQWRPRTQKIMQVLKLCLGLMTIGTLIYDFSLGIYTFLLAILVTYFVSPRKTIFIYADDNESIQMFRIEKESRKAFSWTLRFGVYDSQGNPLGNILQTVAGGQWEFHNAERLPLLEYKNVVRSNGGIGQYSNIEMKIPNSNFVVGLFLRCSEKPRFELQLSDCPNHLKVAALTGSIVFDDIRLDQETGVGTSMDVIDN